MQTTMIVFGLLIVTVGIIMYTVKAKMKNIPLVADHEKILTLTDQNFQHQTKNKLVLIDFWASWCAPCRMMAPILNDLAEELTGNKAIGKLNIEQYQSIAATYNVRSIPTMIMFKNGKEINRFVGIKSKEFLLKEINKVN